MRTKELIDRQSKAFGDFMGNEKEEILKELPAWYVELRAAYVRQLRKMEEQKQKSS